MTDQVPTPPPTEPAPTSEEKAIPGTYVPSTEKPDVIPPVPHAFPASSAPLPEGTEIVKKTPSVQ